MHAIVDFAVRQRWLVVVATLLMAAYGAYRAGHLPVDAVPDITNIQVQINTAAEGFSPLETEQRITYPIETVMAGLPQLDYTRSLSRYGLSQVTVIFDEGTDIYWARQQVSERLLAVRGQLPARSEPVMGPIASGLGEIFMYAVYADPEARRADGGVYTPEDLRTVQDWIIRPQLLKVPGITEINSVGGYRRQYEVAPDPLKLLAFKVSVEDVVEALQRNNRNAGAGYIEHRGEQWLVRAPGQVGSLDEIADIVVTKRDDAPVRVRDLAAVRFGRELRTGAATLDGGEAVQGTAFMLLGENSRTVARAVADALEAVGPSLPDGVRVEALYDRTSLVDQTIATVRTNLLEGAVLVIAVLFALLGNLTAAFIVALVIPLSLLFAITGMAANGVSGNLMSLGAIDFGLIVDGAVIVVENALRRLSAAQQRLGRLLTLPERLQEVIAGTREVFRPAVFGVMIIMLVFLPIFALSGVEGKMFHPMAFTVVLALSGALLCAVTFVPAAVAILVRGRIREGEGLVMRVARRLYRPVLAFALRRPLWIVAGALVLVCLAGLQAARLGAEFLPRLDEHDMAVHALRIPGTGLQQSVAMQQLVEAATLEVPEVRRVFSKIGTAEVANDPMPPNVADTFVMLRPRSEWPDPARPKAGVVEELRAVLEALPGNQYEFTQPIEMRFNELIAGVRADIAVRMYGDDLDTLATLGERARGVIAGIPGAVDVRLEQVAGLPMLSVDPQRDHLSLLGLTVNDLQYALQSATSGIDAGLVYEGDRRFRLLVRMDEVHRRDAAALAQLPVGLPPGTNPELAWVPLGEVADIRQIEGPNQINRRSGKRNVVVTANVEGRDLGSVIADIQRELGLQLPRREGYWLEYGGTFEQLQSAQRRLAIVVPLTLLLVLGLLFTAFQSLREALIVFTGVPLALTGGVAALALRGMPLSMSAAVGFIALSGIAVLNGVVMLTFIRELALRGMGLMEAATEGASQRLRPVLMTALVASLGFVPMALNTGTGAEVQRPLATVVIGGILSSTLLTLVVLPALYRLTRRGERRGSAQDAKQRRHAGDLEP